MKRILLIILSLLLTLSFIACDISFRDDDDDDDDRKDRDKNSSETEETDESGNEITDNEFVSNEGSNNNNTDEMPCRHSQKYAEQHNAKAPTCTDIGWDAYIICTKCGASTYSEKAALGHDEIYHNAQAPTFFETGWDAYTSCSRCDYTTYTPSEVAPPSTVSKNNYNSTFNLSILPDTNSMSYFWVEESRGDTISEAIFTRQEKLKEYLGVTLIAKRAGNYQTYVPDFKAEVDANTGSVHSLLTHVNTGISSLITEGYLRDFQDQERIDLEQDYWNTDIMEAISVADHYFLGFSDFNVPYTYTIAFNKKMLTQLNFVDEGYTVEGLYDSVRNGTWTIDSFLNLATIGHHWDAKNQEVVGLSGQQWVPWIGFMQASGINLVEQNDEGQYVISFFNDANKEKCANLVEMMKEYSKSGYGDLTYPTIVEPGVPNPTHRLTNNLALMELTSTYALPDIAQTSDVSFGVLPYPLYDTNQFDESSASLGYRSLQWGGYLTIPVYLNGDDNMVCDTLEYLAYSGDALDPIFFEKMLGKQLDEAPDDAEMLNIIRESLCSDFGQTFNDVSGTLYTFAYVTREESGKSLVSYHDSIVSSCNKKIRQFILQVEKKFPN